MLVEGVESPAEFSLVAQFDEDALGQGCKFWPGRRKSQAEMARPEPLGQDLQPCARPMRDAADLGAPPPAPAPSPLHAYRPLAPFFG